MENKNKSTRRIRLPINMIRYQRQINNEGEPLTREEKQQVEERVKKIFRQNQLKSRQIVELTITIDTFRYKFSQTDGMATHRIQTVTLIYRIFVVCTQFVEGNNLRLKKYNSKDRIQKLINCLLRYKIEYCCTYVKNGKKN